MNRNIARHSWSVVWPVILAIGFLSTVALMLRLNFFPRPEIFIGVLIVFGVGVLLVLLMIMTISFASLNLTDSKQALGLPEGSIRAMIALILLLVFIIMGIYLFNTAGFEWTITDEGERFAQITDEGERLAQQLITTIGTLVVAVAGFYFGASAVSAAHGVTVPSLPLIRNIDPKEGKPGDELFLKILGKNFRLPKTVRLVRGSNEIVGTGILSSDTEIQCRIKIPSEAQANTTWDLIVVNEDGGEDMLVEEFVVNLSSS